MLLCSVAHLVQRFRGEILFQLDQFEIHTGDKIGLIGANGCGKQHCSSSWPGNANPIRA